VRNIENDGANIESDSYRNGDKTPEDGVSEE
jgi:hypothetical protein